MYVIPSLKHNRFQQVDIPKPSELFKNNGERPGVSYSGDEYVPQDSTKVKEALKVNKDLDDALAAAQQASGSKSE